MWEKKHIFVFVAALQLCNSYRLLLVFPFPSKSHSILGEGYVKYLLQDGHELTYLTPFPLKNPHPNVQQIDISSIFDQFKFTNLSIESLIDKPYKGRQLSMSLSKLLDITRKVILHKNVQSYIADPTQKFDAVIAEWMFSELYSGFAVIFDCPLIWSSSTDPNWLDLRLIDEPVSPAYNAFELIDATVPFSFWQRSYELTAQFKTWFFRYWVIGPKENKLYERAYKKASEERNGYLLPLEKAKFMASFMFGNTHPPLGNAIRLPLNYKAIGGYHIYGSEVIALPEDLQKIMDESKHGAIYFSLGTILEPKTMSQSMKAELLTMFGTLKQTVIWKYDEVPSNLPHNVHIMQWVPQQSILAHPNTVLFITHGGILSILETVHFGVPMIGIPAFADQHMNVAKTARKGIALEVHLTSKIHVDLKDAIENILNNQSEKAKELSAIYHDRPVSPGAELTHWVRHVVRTHGAPHLRSPALMVPWYQKMYLDLLAVVFIFLLFIYLLTKRLLKRKVKVRFNIKKYN